MFLFQRPEGRGLRFYRFEFRVMRIMAIHTEVISSFSPGKVSCPFAMNAGLPVSIDSAMALAA
jgi:hypothetical protein